MKHQAALLLRRLGGHKPHVGSGDSLTEGLGISGVILLPFDIGFDVGRRHQPYRMTKCLQLARPMVRRGASFDADQALRQLLEKRKDLATLQLAADDHLASSINSVNLKDRFGDVETDCRNRSHGGSSESWEL